MPRPCKKRCVRSMPVCRKFGPLDNKGADFILLSIEEYEVIKLIDLESMTQEKASNFLNVSRTTVQNIYKSARKKIAEAIVEKKILHINGGNYQLPLGNSCKKKGKRCCNENRSSKQE